MIFMKQIFITSKKFNKNSCLKIEAYELSFNQLCNLAKASYCWVKFDVGLQGC
jgi:hypothetical protein